MINLPVVYKRDVLSAVGVQCHTIRNCVIATEAAVVVNFQIDILPQNHIPHLNCFLLSIEENPYVDFRLSDAKIRFVPFLNVLFCHSIFKQSSCWMELWYILKQ